MVTEKQKQSKNIHYIHISWYKKFEFENSKAAAILLESEHHRQRCCRFKWLTTWGQAFKIMEQDREMQRGSYGCANGLLLASLQTKQLRPFPLVIKHVPSLCLSIKSPVTSGSQRSRLRCLKVKRLPIGVSLEAFVISIWTTFAFPADGREVTSGKTNLSWKVQASVVRKMKRWRWKRKEGGGHHVYL